MGTWLLAEGLAGVMFMGICLIRRRLSYWPVVVAFLLGDLLRAVGAPWGAFSPGTWGGAYKASLPFVVGIALFVVYASFILVSFRILIHSDRPSAKAAAVTVVLDGLLHVFVPLKPPWMVGEATRWGAAQPLIGSTLAKDINPVAAFPSLHVALPASQGWYVWAFAMSIAVVTLGEHWLIDVLSGWALAIFSRWLVARYWPEVRLVDIQQSAEGDRREPGAVAA